MEQKNRVASELKAWEILEKLLVGYRYMRFSISSYRANSAREWEAVLFMEKGKVLARVRDASRSKALIGLIQEMNL